MSTTNITLTELAQAGRSMRQAQRAYFQFRRRTDAELQAAKGLERRFDEMVAAVLDTPSPQAEFHFAADLPEID